MSPRATRAVEEAARRIVRQRDGHQCRLCGCSIVDVPSSIHHRLPRGRGGSALLERPSNLVRLCGTGTLGCHSWLESNRTLAAYTGWLLPRNNPDIDPTTEPILIHGGRWVLLDDDGNVTPCEAPQEVPA